MHILILICHSINVVFGLLDQMYHGSYYNILGDSGDFFKTAREARRGDPE